jgi:hypothetical protein
MEILNYTPFVPLPFVNQDVAGDDFHVFVLKGTFDIVPGASLRPVREQQPLVMADEYYGDPQSSSVRVESDVIPLKRNGEILLEAVACAPQGQPAKSWTVGVEVGRISKQLRVTGPRRWYSSFTHGWRLTDPQPVDRVAVRFENAFGGRFRLGEREETFDQNPVGKGFVLPQGLDRKAEYEAPQIEEVDRPVEAIGERYEPAGLGPIAKHWLPRRNLCGTADERWLKTRWPMLPDDFDNDYFNGAPEDLIYPGFFGGHETVTLTGMDPAGPLRFTLPNYRIDLFAVDEDDYCIHVAMNLDTVRLDVSQRRANLVWRGTFLKLAPLARATVRMAGPGVVRHAR